MSLDDLTIGLQGLRRVTHAFVTDKSGIRTNLTNPRRTFIYITEAFPIGNRRRDRRLYGPVGIK